MFSFSKISIWSLACAVQCGSALASENLTFNQAVEEGLRSNLDLVAAKYNIPLAEADEATAGLWNNPSILLDTVFQPFGSNWNQTTVGGPRQYDAVISYPFDLSGKISAARNSAHKASEIARENLKDAIRLKVLDIRLAYIEVITQQNQLALTREKETNLAHLVQVIETRIGHSQRLPLLQMRAQLARDQAKLDVRQRESALRAAKVQLSIQLGRMEEDSIHVTSGLRDFTISKLPEKNMLVAKALLLRPDLQALKLLIAKSEADLRLAHAQVWDNFTVTAGISHQGASDPNPNDPNSSVQAGAFSWTAGVTIPLPVFNRSQGTIAKATLAGDQTEKQVASKNLFVRQEIDGLMDQLEIGEELIDSYESKQLNQARNVRDSQQKLFGTGANALLDYFDALTAYQGTFSSYYDAVADYRRNLSRLNAAMGADLIQ
jgi:cobalt-zinc-cadmium efflux system outer membrane protein